MTLASSLLFASALGAHASASRYLERNLAYRSPFIGRSEVRAPDTDEIHERYARSVWKRQTESASPFHDEHYPSFYGSDFSNGDPFDTSIILWTRTVPVSPAGSTSLPDRSVPVCVNFRISDSSDFSKIVDSGAIFTSYDIDFTAKVEATGLQPDTKYFYQFSDCADSMGVSPVGTTRTIASPNTSANKVNGGKPMTLAVFSCSQFQAGWFNAYGFAARNTAPDIFIHLDDYMYESLGNGAPIGRQMLGRELATIHDYRQRLNQYRTDASLDDHEVADNAWKAGTTDSNDTAAGCSFSPSGACFTDRKLAGVRAYHEWMPIRQVDPDDQLRIWRNFQVGKLLDLTMLDTRQYDCDVGYNRGLKYYNQSFYDSDLELVVASLADIDDRSLMGAAQENWFYDTLTKSKQREVARVRSLLITLNIALTEKEFFVDWDAWDGYRSNRRRVLEHVSENTISNTVILAGESHANWVSDLACQ
ncbi:hypothetical protein AMATHDRAFT_675 [Amanita thiersii Skay4041]|uniref:PhoD-like phosphatase metallophosphatase domain-containing protein n=1 Tax=Amanita thiersii Skay4041 TaxID=703135 RepID=A0A2A9NTW2_9AGAR|nr:hypothetical protein AMATHDRAFT_675 [Amanita thiersii Skay4041]